VLKWARRRPTLAALLLVTVLGVAGIVWKYIDAERQKIIALGKGEEALREADKANKARNFLVSIFQLSDPNGPQGTKTPRQILDDAEKNIPEKFADQPELQKELLADIERVYAKITANAPLAMILEARGTVQLRSTTDPKRRAVPHALLYTGDCLSLGADGQVQLVVLSDLHKERLQPGREVTVRRKGCEPTDAVRERAQDIVWTFVPLPKGTFYMGWGGEPRREDDLASSATIVLQGQPLATVALLDYKRWASARVWKTEIKEDFEIAVHDVTQGQWEAIMGNNPSNFCRIGGGRSEVKDFSDEELKLFPVENMTWDDAQEFIKQLNEKNRDSGYLYRLPTEAEWEYACRGGATSEDECSYHFYFARPTNDLSSDQANFHGSFPFGKAPRGNYLGRTTRVGAYAPNKLGLCDMHGSVWQLCADLFDPGGSVRVIRGGGWYNDGSHCRAASRGRSAPTDRSSGAGFRLARVPVRPK
jgi:formylglycine-generating enzyme required for sulfatase activity